MLQIAMGQVASAGFTGRPGVYALGDGFVPLQSQLLLDGTETELLYVTRMWGGWQVPVCPYQHRQDIIEEHTLADPNRIRILRGWSHVDTVTGRYSLDTGHSELFSLVAADLLSVLP